MIWLSSIRFDPIRFFTVVLALALALKMALALFSVFFLSWEVAPHTPSAKQMRKTKPMLTRMPMPKIRLSKYAEGTTF